MEVFTAGSGWDGFQGIENSPAGFAAEDFFVDVVLEQLDNVGKNPHAAALALMVAHFGHGRSGMALGDSSVKFEQTFGDFLGELFAFR